MKIYVICDLEGTAGVIDHRQQCWFDGKYYEQARRLATLELNALVEGALEGGATEIVAWDGHGNFPGGLNIELLHPSCKLVIGAGDAGPLGLDSSFDAMFQCGLHAIAGTPGGVLDHSFWGKIAGCWVNGMPWGEIAMNCYTAGEQGVPSVFISGDRAAAEEARKLVPDIEAAIVKEGLSRQPLWLSPAPTLSLSPEKAREVIRETAKRAMQKIGEIAPYFVEPPYTLRTQFTEKQLADKAATRPGVKRLDAVTVELEHSERLDLIM
jgi:D-amino peptidase